MGRFKVVLVPALITLAVTLLRLTGELLHWSSALFNRSSGGGGALVGIVWLVPIFGAYFGVHLARRGSGPGPLGRAMGLALLALALIPLSGMAAGAVGLEPAGVGTLLVFAVASVAAVILGVRAWRELGHLLFVYGLAARIPVVVVMLLAIMGGWGTHYDVPPQDFPAMGPFAIWVFIGLLPQLTVWMAYTVVVGALFGIPAAALTGRRSQAAG